MIHYQFKEQPNGYCMSREEWIALWEHDEDDMRTFDETLPGETPYWRGSHFKFKDKPTGYHKGKYRDRTPEEQHEHAQSLWEVYTRGYNDEPQETDFNTIVHEDGICNGRKPKYDS